MSNRIERYKEAKENRLAGKYNGAPLFYSFPRLGEVVPIIPRGRQIMTLGGSGTGKSQSWIGLCLLPVYNLIKNHGYKAKFHIFLLEDSKELLEDRLFSRVLYMKSGKQYAVDQLGLNSMRKDLVPDEVEEYYKEVDEIVEDILSHCEVYDSIYNATGIYKSLRTESAKQGEHVWEDRQFTYNKKDGSTFTEDVKVYKEYIPKDPDVHNIVIIDNLNNLSEEYDKKAGRMLNIREAISKWTRDYARLQIVKHWNWTVWNIMQTSLDTDKKEQTKMYGDLMVERLEPNLASLGDNKICARDMHLILGLFAPARFGISSYADYNIDKLGDTFRALIILKSNFSAQNLKVPLYFNGACSYYSELPKSDVINYINYE